jgi:hypothetical protein
MGDSEGTGRVSLAELLLAQGTEPQKAFDLIDEAMRAKGNTARRLEGGRWAHKAWALALLGRRREADEAIERAWKATPDVSPRPVLAIRHWTVGMALQ